MARDLFAGLAPGAGKATGKGKQAVTDRTTVPGGNNRVGPSRRDPFAGVEGKAATEPLEAIEPGDAEGAMKEELSEVLQGFKARARQDDSRRKLASDGAFYAALIFPTAEHRDAFFDKLGMPDAKDLNFLDGMKVARKMQIELPPVPTVQHSVRSGGTWLALGTLGIGRGK